ncbi:uncharacterized protein LOC143463520 [Clavelina lepadiformis]|uniref:Protein-PII uridylyltransferase N-terminal domain-containing protein n=1 Tax=Clavelina lepadiformis TaxID=159417 RepID=A0ABP0GLR4_CLALP
MTAKQDEVQKKDQEICLKEENDLANLLRQSCYDNGKERNPKESAAYIHQLGLLYQKQSYHKINMVRSAALLNAAIVRQPDNVETIRNDLQQLCKNIFKMAKAKHIDEDLIKEADIIKAEVKCMREQTEKELNRLQKIPSGLDESKKSEKMQEKINNIIRIQNDITEKYTNIMKAIVNVCERVMGSPPCRYVMTGLGSLARKEITPYSDFESAIVLEEGVQNQSNYSDIQEYFRWFTVIFQVILVSLKETVIRFLALRSLNDPDGPNGDWFYDNVTTCGICPDGFAPHANKTPLGREEKTSKKPWKTELIKPVSEMVKYLDGEEDLKNGYHLADVLVRTCYVSGDQMVYDNFQSSIHKKLDEQKHNGLVSFEYLRENEKNLELFDPSNSVPTIYGLKETFDMKRVIYRTATIFVSAAGRRHAIKEQSCFDILSKLVEHDIITQEFAFQMKFAVAIACEIRLRTYIDKQGQDDFVNINEELEKDAVVLVDMVGADSILGYFEAVHIFHWHARLDWKVGKNVDFSIETTIIPLVCLNFKLFNEGINRTKKKLLELELKNKAHLVIAQQCMLHLALFYTELGRFPEAIEQYQKCINTLEPEKSKTSLLSLKYVYHRFGDCHWRMEKYENALTCFEKQMKCYEISDSKIVDEDTANKMSICFKRIAFCLMELGDYQKPLDNLNKALQLRNSIRKNLENDMQISVILFGKANCLIIQKKYGKALEVLNESLKIERRASRDEKVNKTVADNLYQTGWCLYKMHREDDSLKILKEELEIRQNLAIHPEFDEEVCDCLAMIGLCQIRQGNFEQALNTLRKVLATRQALNDDENQIASCFYHIGRALLKLGRKTEAKKNFEIALCTRKRSFVEQTTEIQKCLKNIEKCLE